MALPQYRVFFDTSVYIAGLLSAGGAARALLYLAEAGAIQMIVSEKVITEADQVLTKKFPELVQESRKLWKELCPEIALTPTADQLKPFRSKLPENDNVILCSAYLAKAAVFVTWNTRDFMAQGVQSLVDFPIVVPADALKLFRKWIEPLLD